MRHFLISLFYSFLVYLSMPSNAHAQTIKKTIQFHGHSVPALASFTPGARDKPAFIVLHGFLTHTLQDEIGELGQWINGLLPQGYPGVVLVGHSSGSALILAYLQRKHYPSFTKGVILTSLFYLTGPELGTRAQEVSLAQSKVAKGVSDPQSSYN